VKKRGRGDQPDDEEPERKAERKTFVFELEVNQEFDEEEEESSMFVDDKTGDKLDAKLVEKAEEEEIEFMIKIELGVECDVSECWEKTGKAPTSTKFVRVNKGTPDKPDVRARLCGRDFKAKGEGSPCELFAAMPPLESKKMLFREAAKSQAVWKRGRWRKPKLMFIDVKKAHLNAMVPEGVFVYVLLPDGRCWRLRRWLYGMRPAASAWELDFTTKLESIGFQRGRAAPTAFFNRKTGCRLVVHGDDFTFMGCDIDLKEVANEMGKWYEIKIRGVLGDDDGDDKD